MANSTLTTGDSIMTQKSITTSSSVDNSSVTNIPGNPPSNLSSALLPQNAGSAEAVPRAAPAPAGKPPVKLGDPITVVWDFHELANIFPMTGSEAYAQLRDDIKKYGLLEPITVWDNKILDGRNRAKACMELGIEPVYVEYTGNDPVGFILSKHIHRRQMTQSQLAMLVKKLENLPKGRPDLNACAFTQDEAAKRLGVSPRLLQLAKKVHEKAIPEVAALVEAGKLTVDKAATLSEATPEQQREAVTKVEAGEKCPTFKPQKDSQEKNPKEPSLEDLLTSELKAALALPRDSQERSEALTEVFISVIEDCFLRKIPREEFLQGILAKCVELGGDIHAPPAVAGTET
jgi:ParB-like chromosome segregation protein Spo0J